MMQILDRISGILWQLDRIMVAPFNSPNADANRVKFIKYGFKVIRHVTLAGGYLSRTQIRKG
jgi:hypothetical protein